MNPVDWYRNRPATRNDLANHPDISGLDLSGDLDFDSVFASLASTGFQASNLSSALEVIKAMRREGATIFFGCTSNIISSGLRDIVRYLVEHKFVDCVVTTAGGIEEDIIKTFGSFKLGSFRASGSSLVDEGVHRIGNVFVPTDRYTDLDLFLSPLLDDLYRKQSVWTVHSLLKEVGVRLDSDESFLTWAARNDIPVVCPALQDGAFGDILYFRSHQNKNLVLDVSSENKVLVDLALSSEKTGALVLGGGSSKHMIYNANILRDGLNYVVNITTAQEFDGSDSGGHLEEAVSWFKIQPDAMRVTVHAEASLVFPFLSAAWMRWERQR